jgi:hypothetical protein
MFLAYFLHNRRAMKNTKLHRHVLGTSGCTIAAILLLVSQTARGDIIPAQRLIDWTKAGVPGGIPFRTTIYTNISSGASESVIQAALNTCPSNQVVMLGSGTFTLSSQLQVPNSYITLRGSTNTYLVLSTTCMNCGDAVVEISFNSSGAYWSASGNSGTSGYTANNVVNWTGGYAQGTTVLTLASTVGLKVGQILGLDEASDGSNTYSQGEAGNTGMQTWACRGAGDRVLQQYVLVTAINNASNVTISPGLYSPFWASNLNPQAFWSSNSNIQYSGIEDLDINAANEMGNCVDIVGGYACWVRNVTFHKPGGQEATTLFSKNCEFRHCTFSDLPIPPNSGLYGFQPVSSSDLRFEDNIFSNYYNGINMVGVSGSVFAFNYFTNDLTTVKYPSSNVGNPTFNFFPHAGHPNFNLVEGNYARAQVFDATWGNSSYMTTFRNRLTGWEGNAGYCERLMEHAYYVSSVGNVYGTSGENMDYDGRSGNDIWCWADWVGDWQTDTRTNDVRVTNTLFRAGNWDVVNNTVVWGTNAVQSISNSYAYATKPSWFGNRPWPPFDPSSASAASPTNIPAGYRFLFGVDPPSGVVAPPAPPANLIVQ